MQKEWYVVNTYSGHENKVKEKLEMRVKTLGLEDYIFRIVVPEQTEVENKNGEIKEKKKKMFPGYILVEMIMTDDTWYKVRNTPGVTGFIGSSGKGAKPFPLTPQEVDKILNAMGMRRVEIGGNLEIGDKVRIIDGPFKDMLGEVKTVDKENNKLEIDIDLFGQVTTVDLDINEIEKV